MDIDIEERVIMVADFVIDNKSTVRDTASEFGVSKSTIHADITKRLESLDIDRYRKAREVLEYNFSVRHLRGGESTKRKYQRIK